MSCVNKNFLPSLCDQHNFICTPKSLPVENVNYDYLPTELESPKVFFVTTKLLSNDIGF